MAFFPDPPAPTFVDPFDPPTGIQSPIPSALEGGFFRGPVHGGASYGLALWAMTVAPIAIVAGLRETSVIFGTIFACLFWKEQFGPVRYAAAVLVTIGGVAIKVF